MHLLNLIRYKNLLLIVLVQILVKYALFDAFGASTTLNWFEFCLLALSTICIASGGYIINDIFDIETDSVNKPQQQIVGKHFSENQANGYYMIFTLVGVCLGFYLSHLVGKSTFFSIFVIIAALLYIYASFLKQMLLVGNLVVSMIVALSLIIVGILDLLPAINPQNKALQSAMFEVLFDYSIFAFLITLIRELVKDIQDVDGDYKAQMKTLPILIGKDRAAKVSFGLTILSILILVYYLGTYLYMRKIAVVYFIIAVVGPLVYVAIKLFFAEHKKDYKLVSNLLKLVMLLGMLSMVIYLI